MHKLGLLVLTCAFAFTASSAIAQAPAAPQTVTVCQVLASPSTFNGKIVTLQANVFAGLDNFDLRDNSCKQVVNAIWLDYPEGYHGHAGPSIFVDVQPASNAPFELPAISGPSVSIEKNKDLTDFDKLLSTPAKTKGLCLGCIANSVSATLTGRIDAVETPGIQRDPSGKVTALAGFGNARMYRVRIVLQSVADVQPHPIDFSKLDAPNSAPAGSPATGAAPDAAPAAGGGGRGGRGGGGGGGRGGGGEGPTAGSFGYDPAARVRTQYTSFAPDSVLSQDLKRAGAVFPPLGESNGVRFANGIANEARKSDDQKSGKSPDNLTFQVVYDSERLTGPTSIVAITFAGSLIADFRDPALRATAPPQVEFHAWLTALYSVLATHQPSAAAAGGHQLWSSAWSGPGMNDNINQALRALFLSLPFTTTK